MVIFRRFLAVAGGLVLALTPVSAASADVAACQPSVQPFFEAIPPPTRVIPEPLLGFSADCAIILIADDPDVFDLLYLDVEFETAVAMLRSLEQAGWVENVPGDGTISGVATENPIYDSDGEIDFESLDFSLETSADIVALGYEPVSISASFTDPQAAALEDPQAAVSLAFDYRDGTYPYRFVESQEPFVIIQVVQFKPLFGTGITDRSVLSSLRTVEQAAPNGVQVAVLATVAALLVLVIGWPGALLSAVMAARYEQLFGWSRRPKFARVRNALDGPQPRWLLWVGLVVAALFAGFLDRNFGFNLMSVRMVATGFLTFVILNVIGWWVVTRVLGKFDPSVKPQMRIRWGSLAVVLGSVVAARLLEFAPGVIFGLIAGLTFATTLATSRKALVVLVGSGYAVAIGLSSWVAYSLTARPSDDNFGPVFLTELLAGVTIGGVSTLPLALLPFAALDGGDLVKWKRWVWAVSYAVGIAAFMLVLLTIPDTASDIPADFTRWIAVFVLYALIAVGAWIVHTSLEKRAKSDAVRP